jgi:hypothetical protein
MGLSVYIFHRRGRRASRDEGLEIGNSVSE